MRRRVSSSCLLLVLLALSLTLFTPLAGYRSAADTGLIQLVRLNISKDTGLVRIEITADGSLSEATIEQLSRGRQTVIRIRGARSLLRHSYEVGDEIAREVRTLTGERDGEPYVDVLIALGDGATVAQKRSFNRLVIGVAADFAHLRRNRPAAGELAKVSPDKSIATAASAPRLAASVNNSASAPPWVVDANGHVIVLAETSDAPGAKTSLQVNASAPPTIFRGRTIWNSLSDNSLRLSRLNAAGFSPMFFVPQTGVTAASSAGLMNFVGMTLEPPGAQRGVWVPGTTVAERDEVGGKVLGPGFLRPSVLLGATYDDNFFYRSGVGRNLGVFTLAPRLEYELPGTEKALRLAYEAQLRRLTNGKWANGHFLDFDTRFNLTPFLRLSLRDHFARSALDPHEYDSAGEVYIVGDTFNRNDAELRFDYSLNARSRLALGGSYNIVRWSKEHIAAAPLFIDYDELSGKISFERDISEESTFVAGFNYTSGLADAPLRPQFDGLNNVRRFQLHLGGRTQVTETSGATFFVGFERSLFRNAPSLNNYSGLIFDLRFRRSLTANTNFELAALRKTQVSAFNLEAGNARLLSTGAAARVENDWTENLKLGLALNYQQLGFPVAIVPNSTASGGVFVGQFAGERRKDHLYGFSLEAAYRWSDLMKTRFAYVFSRRDSTIPVFTFNRNRLSLIFEIGRRNDVKGRPF